MDDSLYRRVIYECSSRIIELEPLGPNVAASIPCGEYQYVVQRILRDEEAVISSCSDNVLVWNTLLYCLRSLSRPLIPFELVHNRVISLELVCILISKLPEVDRLLLETVILAINIILFPDLRFDATERNPDSGNALEEEGASFPDIISTIGFAICRPFYGTYLSITHKSGFDEIGVLLTLILDNKRWLFQLSDTYGMAVLPSQSSFMQTPASSLTSSQLQSLVKSTVTVSSDEIKSLLNPQTLLDTINNLNILLKKQLSYEPFIHYSSQPMFPPEPTVVKYPSESEVRQLLQVPQSREITVSNSVVEQEQQQVYNVFAESVLSQLQAGEETLSAIFLQAVIRKRNNQFVYHTCISDVISKVPKRHFTCCYCYRTLPRVNYTDYFDESDWSVPISFVEKQSREYQIQFVESLQVQLIKVEDRLVCNNKLRVISSNECLFEKYTYYYQVIEIVYP